MAATSGRLPHGQGAPDSISIAVLRSLNIEEIFPELHEHMIPQPLITISFNWSKRLQNVIAK